ncbi:conserved protein of unknown function [Burkholderia multivorans]
MEPHPTDGPRIDLAGVGIGVSRHLEYKRDRDVMEAAMKESLMAYLMGPAVMVIVGASLWIAAHSRRKENQGRHARWLDTHYVDLMHRRH